MMKGHGWTGKGASQMQPLPSMVLPKSLMVKEMWSGPLKLRGVTINHSNTNAWTSDSRREKR
jgi:hypothetical protein